MKKDTIYIDIEDDITAVIDKVTSSSSRVVALVPPKRPELLQSVVNLKLLMRSAKQAKKTVVLVSTNKALQSLAGGVGMHTAKDLHTKPSIPEAPDLDTADEVSTVSEDGIDATQAIGVLDSAHKSESKEGEDDTAKEPKKSASKKASPKKPDAKKSKRPSVSIPNFDRFRSKVFIGIAAVILLAAGWWYAFIQAPTATIAINAQTSRIETVQEVTADVTLDSTNIEEFMLAATSQEITRTITEKAPATGEKDVGQKASGVVTIQNCDSSSSFTINAGTGFSANDLTFISGADVVVPGASFSGGSCDAPGVADVTVTAQNAGDQYNLTSGTAYTIANVGSLVTGIGGQMAGGTSETVKVLAQSDVDAADQKIDAANEAEIKTELAALFEGDQIVIDESYVAERGETSVAPGVGEETDEATVSVTYTYSQLSISRADLEAVLQANQTAQFDENQQSLYESGIDSVRFSLDTKLDTGKLALTVRTSAFIGPKIDQQQLAESITGMRFSEVVETVKQVPGVTDVDVDFEPFWVFSAPRSADKIEIQLQIAGQEQ